MHVRALDAQGQSRVIEADGLLAVCIQHEMDHLMGKVFVEYLSPPQAQPHQDQDGQAAAGGARVMRAALCVPPGRQVLALAALVCSLVACALPARSSPALRASEWSHHGPPHARLPLPTGQRLLYSELPAGFAAAQSTLDASANWCATSRC